VSALVTARAAQGSLFDEAQRLVPIAA